MYACLYVLNRANLNTVDFYINSMHFTIPLQMQCYVCLHLLHLQRT